MRSLLKFGLTIILTPLVYVLFAVILALVPVNCGMDAPKEEAVEIFIASNGVHADFVLPIASDSMDWQAFFPASNFRGIDPSSMTHIAFGWGDRGFFLETPTWADLKVSTAVNALFLKSRTAMHVTFLRDPRPTERVKGIMITQRQYAQLVDYITSSFMQKANGELEWISGSGYDINDTFYKAKGTYHLFNTCNDWTGKGLRQIGVKTGIWTPFSQSVLFYL